MLSILNLGVTLTEIPSEENRDRYMNGYEKVLPLPSFTTVATLGKLRFNWHFFSVGIGFSELMYTLRSCAPIGLRYLKYNLHGAICLRQGIL